MSHPVFDINLEGDDAWLDLKGKRIHHTTVIQAAALSKGMRSGRPSVVLRIDLEDGSAVVAETSLGLFLTVADMLKAKFGDPRQQEGESNGNSS